MTTTSKIDFERAAILMDVVAKVAHVGPAYLALSGAAMNELKEMNDVALAEQKVLGEERLAAEQKAAAKLNAEAQARATAEAPKPKAIPAASLKVADVNSAISEVDRRV